MVGPFRMSALGLDQSGTTFHRLCEQDGRWSGVVYLVPAPERQT